MKKNKAKINYYVDIVIGLAFLAAAISGLVLFLAGSGGGYRGGRNPDYLKTILFFSRSTWKDLHDWSGIIMMIGVAGHLILHWKWIVCMTRNLVRRIGFSRPASRRKMEACPTEG